MDLYLRPVDLDEALTAALDDLGTGGRALLLRLPNSCRTSSPMPLFLTRVLTALGADALRHSTPDAPPTLTAEARPGRLTVRITDGTADAPTGARADSLPLRLSRDLTEAMGGTLEAAAPWNTPPARAPSR